MDEGSTRRIDWRRVLPICVVGVGILAYANCFSGTFLLDDAATIVRSRQVRNLWPPWDAVKLQNRWFTDITFAVNYAADGLNPAGYHAVNLLIHLLAGLLLYGVVRRTLSGRRLSARYGPVSHWLAGAVAGIWVVHPLQTESVTYICQRYESMMGLFYLLMLYCFIRATESERGSWWFVASVAAWVIGAGTKIVIATAPIVILAYDWLFVSASFRDLLRRRWRYYTVIAATFILPLVVLIRLLVRNAGWDVPFVARVSPLSYVLTQLQVIAHYFRLSFVPHPLVFDYRWPLISSASDVLIPGAIVVALAGVSAWSLFRRNSAAFPGVWFFLILAPTSSVIPLSDAAAEHRMYLPLAAVIVAIVVAVYEILGAVSRRVSGDGPARAARLLGTVACIVVVLLFAGLTANRNRDYASPERMWADVVARRPENWRAHFQLCAALYEAGKYRAVVEHCGGLIGRLPRFGAMELPEVLERGKGPGGEEFMAQADAYARAQDSLGCVAQVTGDPQRALGYLTESVRLGAGDWNRRVNLGVAYYSLGMLNEAIEQWTIASKLPRHDNTPYHYLGMANERIGNAEEAIRLYGKALWYQPDDILVQDRLAWILSTCADARLRNGLRAVKLAEAACRAVDYRSCELLNALAAAHAECGLFDKAVGCQRRALELLHRGPDAGSATADRIREYERRLDLYLRKEPCRTGANSSETTFPTKEN